MNHGEVLELIERELDSLFRQQSERASKLAHRLIPELTPEDLLNPDDYPQLLEAPEFMFEHGEDRPALRPEEARRGQRKVNGEPVITRQASSSR
jgi:hypothetical protein